MTKFEALEKWIANRQRIYADGVAYFQEFASEDMKKVCEKYFLEVTEPKQFDPHFTLLVSKLSAIFSKMRIAPNLYKGAFDSVAQVIDQELNADQNAKIKSLIQEVDMLNSEKEELEEKISELESDTEDHEDEIDNLKHQLTEKSETIDTLKSEIDTLSTEAGIKIVAEKDLPPTISKLYVRIKEITPLIAHLHAQLITASADEDRKKVADDLCKLDDERRSAWDKIDEWSEGKVLTLDEPKPEYSDDAVVRGSEIQLRLIRLKENIRRSSESAAKFKAENKLNKEAGALSRLAGYQAEFDKLTAELNAK